MAGHRHGEALLPGRRRPRRRPGCGSPTSARSSSGPVPGRSPGCGSASRPPRGSPTASASRSSACRPGDDAPRGAAPTTQPVPGRWPSSCRPAVGPDPRPSTGAPTAARPPAARSPSSTRPGRPSSPSIWRGGHPTTPLARGERARDGLGRGPRSDRGGAPPAGRHLTTCRLVPAYVTLPRGVREERGEIEWSRDPR